jgi:hypothetical protein
LFTLSSLSLSLSRCLFVFRPLLVITDLSVHYHPPLPSNKTDQKKSWIGGQLCPDNQRDVFFQQTKTHISQEKERPAFNYAQSQHPPFSKLTLQNGKREMFLDQHFPDNHWYQ